MAPQGDYMTKKNCLPTRPSKEQRIADGNKPTKKIGGGKKLTELLPESAFGLPTPPPEDTTLVTFPTPMDQQDAVPTLGVTPFIDSEHRLPPSEVCRATGVQNCHCCDDLSCGDNASPEADAARIHALPPNQKYNSFMTPAVRRLVGEFTVWDETHNSAEFARRRHQAIEKLAYARYERTGCTDAFVNWLWAERVLDGKLVGWKEQEP
jgi:hypothetical protein